MDFHGNMTLEKFFLEWFGLCGREIGSSEPCPLHTRLFTENPNDMLEMIKYCEDNKLPAWVSSQPRNAYGSLMGLEKIFLDFDDDTKYCPECKKWYVKDDLEHLTRLGNKNEKKTQICIKHQCPVILKPRKEEVGEEVKHFLQFRVHEGTNALVIETNKGYHIYLFLPRIYIFDKKNLESVKKIYISLVQRIIGNSYRYIDSNVQLDTMRMARIPLTVHEVTGERCRIMRLNDKYELVEDKIRSITYYRNNAIPVEELILAVKEATDNIEKEKNIKIDSILKAGEDLLSSSFSKQIRPCFQKRMEGGEMTHAQRLAFIKELYYNGYKGNTDAETEEKITAVFRDNFNDFIEQKTRYYVKYFLRHEPDVYPPYRCETLIEKRWCLGTDCLKWLRDHPEHNINK